jgi:hypothetical protein
MQTDLLQPKIGKFAVLCEPSGQTIYVRAASFNGAKRAVKAKINQFSAKKDQRFSARFIMWERCAGDPKCDGIPPQDFDWSKILRNPNDQHHSEPPEAVIECVLWFCGFFFLSSIANRVANPKREG